MFLRFDPNILYTIGFPVLFRVKSCYAGCSAAIRAPSARRRKKVYMFNFCTKLFNMPKADFSELLVCYCTHFYLSNAYKKPLIRIFAGLGLFSS